MIKQLLGATTLLVVATAQAAPQDTCVTNELDESVITAELALAVGNCHMARATQDGSVAALEYAHSWFQQARKLGASEAQKHLDAAERQLEQAGHAND
ncbi:hypothetical protein [Pseudomonas tohonis]|uniref:hypothetical protein n=1 Tax=Pseudomonas tohonis TaxID=2725477 RepID=UPI0021D8FF6A|nr:hypothetical protein [Pseudomonas tohonis]UXY55543.1 hypothetical protein N9L84_13525 [Pseudomonas tohonis]